MNETSKFTASVSSKAPLSSKTAPITTKNEIVETNFLSHRTKSNNRNSKPNPDEKIGIIVKMQVASTFFTGQKLRINTNTRIASGTRKRNTLPVNTQP